MATFQRRQPRGRLDSGAASYECSQGTGISGDWITDDELGNR